MPTTTASLTLTSTDLLSDSLSIVTTANLTKAGTKTGLSQTSGLARKTLSSASSAVITAEPLFRGDGATADGANKVYIKNTSVIASEYVEIYIDQEEMGRLYAGDWAFFPWKAASGTKETFVVTSAGTVAAGEAGAAGVVTGSTAITGDTITDLAGSDLTMAITSGAAGTRSESDIFVKPSVETEVTVEYMLINE